MGEVVPVLGDAFDQRHRAGALERQGDDARGIRLEREVHQIVHQPGPAEHVGGVR